MNRWVPDRAAYFTVRTTRGGRGLDIEFFRSTDMRPEDARPIVELPHLLARHDTLETRRLARVRTGLAALLKEIDEYA